MPLLSEAVRRWRSRTLLVDTLIILALVTTFLAWTINTDQWQGLTWQPAWLDWLEQQGLPYALQGLEGALVIGLLAAHLAVRRLAALSVLPWLRKQVATRRLASGIIDAFLRNTRSWRTVLTGRPRGWGRDADGAIGRVLHDCERYVQSLNERFTNPRGLKDAPDGR